ncbi:Protein fuzzy-like protein [Frankliniella fusca]|uniref:Protein fuzzy-like protein n=1 Tax=Frankliniella fusca TaxID=407009 RepID=A0AAE1H5I8_9NEOP|nr:Protein fuzzy-like protein [Frankliniella fusca]
MTVHILCITSAGGLPLFTRKRGDGEVLPFSIVASLNGVHMFCKSQNVILKSTSTPDTTFVWEEFEGSIILVAAASCSNEATLRKLLNAVFNAMLLMVGVDDIRNIRNPDRLKRELRVCYPLIDKFMDGMDGSTVSNSSASALTTRGKKSNINSETAEYPCCGNLIGMSETILSYESNDLMACLDAYADCLNSQFACLLVYGRELVSTPAWTDLHPLERQLLTLLTVVSSPSTSSDTPIFLPFKSPSIPFRLIWVLLVPGVSILGLCGPTPSLSEAEHLALQCWGSSADHLRSITQLAPRNFPHSIQLDSNVLGFLLINTDVGKYVLSYAANDKPVWQGAERTDNNTELGNPVNAPSSRHRLQVLQTFYHQAVEPLLLAADTPNKKEKGDIAKESSPLESYWCSEYHKCHGIRRNANVLCVLYPSSVPTHTMRMYALRKVKDEFRVNKCETDPKKIEAFVSLGKENLNSIRRQVIVANLYRADNLVIEKKIG